MQFNAILSWLRKQRLRPGYQIMLIMRLTCILLLCCLLNASAGTIAQNVNLSFKEAPLQEVLKAIKKQTNYTFFANTELLKNAKKVTIDVHEISVTEALDRCFKDQSFTYTIEGQIISLKPRDPGLSPQLNPRPVLTTQIPQNDIIGIVKNVAGEPLAGANVVVKRTGYGTQTDVQGKFQVKDAQPEDILAISYTGYSAKNIKVSEVNENINIILEVAQNELDIAVVQAYGTTTKRLATGNIAKVTAAEIEKQPVMNPLMALQGKVPGLEVVQTSGYASAPFKVELRGRSSVGDFAADPLYIIDGVPLTVLDLRGGGYPYSHGFIQNRLTGPANGQSPFFSINPSDIESIEVLKDADATAIYGSRGANGVILITTKKGKAGNTQFDVSVQHGITKVTRYWNMLNTEQYLKVRKEAFANDQRKYGLDGQTVPNDDFAWDLTKWDTTRYTDWQRLLYGNTGRSTIVQADLSGGNANTTFRIGAGYNRTTSVTAVTGADQKSSLSFNVTHKTKDQRLSVSLSTAYNYSEIDMITLLGTIILPPNAPAILDEHGNLNYEEWRVSRIFPFCRVAPTIQFSDYLLKCQSQPCIPAH